MNTETQDDLESRADERSELPPDPETGRADD